MQISWDDDKSKEEALKQLGDYRVMQIIELMKDDKEQLKQFLDTIGKGDTDITKLLDNFS